MHSKQRGLFSFALVLALAMSVPVFASDREAGPRGRAGDTPIARFVKFIIHAFDEFSFPPG